MLIPILYLKGVSTGDFEEALGALLGKDGGLSASTITRLKEAWVDEHARWLDRDLSAKRYVYVWADGIYVQARLEDDAQCLLVIIGATAEGKKELVGLADGIRESAQSWKELLLDLKRRGLTIDPQLAIADGALGFWKAIEEVWPKTRAQRCWVHKTANVLNRLPKSLQPKAKSALQDIWMAETRKAAEAALDAFIETYGIKYEKAVECLTKDREALFAFYDFPAEHWKHLRTTNPIESTFATVRHRTVRSRGCLSNKTALAMIFKPTQAAEKRWHRLRGHHQLPKVILGVKFNDGIEIVISQLKPLPPDLAHHQDLAIALIQHHLGRSRQLLSTRSHHRSQHGAISYRQASARVYRRHSEYQSPSHCRPGYGLPSTLGENRSGASTPPPWTSDADKAEMLSLGRFQSSQLKQSRREQISSLAKTRRLFYLKPPDGLVIRGRHTQSVRSP